MKILLRILAVICITSNICQSQTKKDIYLDEQGNYISKAQFNNKLNYRQNLDLYFETDSTFISKLISRKSRGKLSSGDFANLKQQLSPDKLSNNEMIVIVYFPGKDTCNGMERVSTWNIFDPDYLRKLEKITPLDHFWIYKKYDQLDYYHPDKVKWQPDPGHLVEALFFQYHYNCSSLAVIDPAGNFTTYFGEFGKQTVWDIAVEMKKNL